MDEGTSSASLPTLSEMLLPGLNTTTNSGKHNSTHWKPTCWILRKRSKSLMIPPASHDSTTLVLRRTFTASRLRVFRAWIEPKALEHWLRPRGMSMTVSSLEARVGGSFRFNLENGGSIFGTYLQIVPPEKLVFTWSGEAIQGRETVVTF